MLRSLVLGGVAIAMVPVQPTPIVAYALWVVALVIVGMPHGAFDIAVVCDQIESQGWRAAATTATIYTVFTAIAAACFILAPSITVVVFLGLSAHHFGVSDCVWTRGRPIRSFSEHMIGLSHGVAVLAVPFFSSPLAAWSPFVQIADAAGGALHVDASLTRIVAATLWSIAILLQLTVWVSRRKDSRLVEQASVIVSTTMLGLAAPPLLAIGVYFLVIHALGHCSRADAKTRRSRSPGFLNAVRVHWRSAPLTIPSVGIVVVIAATVFGSVGISSVAHAFLLFCVIGTLPHHLLWLSAFGPLRSQP
jgi:Brp/Blh family beta-carotene 15,15'-monooxygenase